MSDKRFRKDDGEKQVRPLTFIMDVVFQFLKGRSEEDGIPDVEEEEEEEDDIIHETLFTFEAFESVWNSSSWCIPYLIFH